MRISDWSSDVCSSDLDYADDLVQSCLVRAIGALETWEPGTNMRAWLFTILRNVLINEYRRAQRSPVQIKDMLRSEERRVGKECVSQCRSRWSQDQLKKKT